MAFFSIWRNPAPEGLAKGRIEALADGIFSVAMTLLVLEITLPSGESLPTHSDLLHRLLALESSLTIYVINLVPLASAVVAFYSARIGLYLYFRLAPLHFLPKASVQGKAAHAAPPDSDPKTS